MGILSVSIEVSTHGDRYLTTADAIVDTAADSVELLNVKTYEKPEGWNLPFQSEEFTCGTPIEAYKELYREAREVANSED